MALLSSLNLYNDIVNNRLVTSLYDSSAFVMPTLFYGEILNVNYYPVTPIANSGTIVPGNNPAYRAFTGTANSFQVKCGIGPVDGSYSPLFQSPGDLAQWAIDSTNTFFIGQISLYTSAMQTAMNGKQSLNSNLQIELSDTGGSYIVEYSGPVVINQPVISPAGVPTPSGPLAQFYTKAELDALFVKFRGNENGSTITLPSPSGTHSRIIGANDVGSALDSTT
jgi:hypothetical protein